MGGMNIFFVVRSGDDVTLVTPALNGALLPGVTRDSLLSMVRELGFRAEERLISTEEWQAGNASGEITEVFACGTAAVVTPIAHVKAAGREWTIGDGEPGPVTQQVRAALLGVQTGETADPHGWMHQLVPA